MATIAAKWTKLAAAPSLQRSSHNVSTVGSTVYIFGGELKPREPRDNDLHRVDIQGLTTATVSSLPAPSTAPGPRVGASTTTIDQTIFLFSGRGGVAMAPIDEHGAVWALSTPSHTWSLLQAPSTSPFPEARSYHCAAADPATHTLYLHAGCPASGRLADLWSFHLPTRTWTPRAPAPGPARGGASLAFADGRLYRMHGFDGARELGGALDVYDPPTDRWHRVPFAADGIRGPAARSVAALVPVRVAGAGAGGDGDETLLVTLGGERDPSALGHQGAGKMLADVWAYAIRRGEWARVVPEAGEGPTARGWFDADVVVVDGGGEGVVVAGGLGESNERLDDLWLLSF